MKILEKLTPEQEALIPKIRDEWINFALFNGDAIDQQTTYDGIDFIYELSGLKKPIKIIVDSPVGVQLAIPQAIALLKKLKSDQVRDQVSDQVYGQVRDQVFDQVRDQVFGQVYGQVRGQVRDQVYGQVRDQVYGQVYGQVRDQVYGQVKYELFTNDTLAWYAGWIAWIEYFRTIGITVNNDNWPKYIKYMRSGQFMGVYLDGLAIVCRRPQQVYRDEQLRLHSEDNPAISWRDGYKLYFLHGVAFKEEIWHKLVNQQFTMEDLHSAGLNSDQSSEALFWLSPEKLLKQINAVHIHTGRKGTKLYKVNKFLEATEPQYCMLMEHPTIKHKMFLEWVDPKVGKLKDADLAQCYAWQDEAGNPIPLEDYLNAIEA